MLVAKAQAKAKAKATANPKAEAKAKAKCRAKPAAALRKPAASARMLPARLPELAFVSGPAPGFLAGPAFESVAGSVIGFVAGPALLLPEPEGDSSSDAESSNSEVSTTSESTTLQMGRGCQILPLGTIPDAMVGPVPGFLAGPAAGVVAGPVPAPGTGLERAIAAWQIGGAPAHRPDESRFLAYWRRFLRRTKTGINIMRLAHGPGITSRDHVERCLAASLEAFNGANADWQVAWHIQARTAQMPDCFAMVVDPA